MESDNKPPLLTQKEYLKRYLSKDKNKKKKKKPTISSSTHIKRSVIIDDDLGLKDVANIDDEEFNLDYLGDEAPQVVGIIDERPIEIKAKEIFDSNLWRTVGDTNNVGDSFQDSNKSKLTKTNVNSNSGGDIKDPDCDLLLGRPDSTNVDRARKIEGSENNDHENCILLQKKNDQKKYNNVSDLLTEKIRHKNERYGKGDNSDSDLSPDRSRDRNKKTKRKHGSDSDQSPARNNAKKRVNKKKYSSDSDLSPERNRGQGKKERHSDSDVSSERNRGRKKNERQSDSDMSPDRNRENRKKKHSDSNLSPRRYRDKKKKECGSDSDMSPPRRSSKISKSSSNRDSDINVLRRKEIDRERKDSIPNKINHDFDHHYKARKKSFNEEASDNEMSHTKKLKYDNRYKYRESEKEYRNKLDKSYGRSERSDSSRYGSKERYRTERSSIHSSRKYQDDPDLLQKPYKSSRFSQSKDRRQTKDSDSDLSPTRNRSQSEMKRNKTNSRVGEQEKMQDGKKSGLQDAKHLKEELKRLKANEDKMFKKMDPSVLGATAVPIQRDRKTGMVRQIEKEKEEERNKAERRAETESKYYRWGRGLKQIEDQEDRVANAIHEMSKPLARYRDDKDLDAYLKAQEREGDPMLDYIKSKQAESHNVIDLDVGSSKLMYNGSYMPNRFGIRPGYRWDGVDRSNGYEKKWFEQKNARKATEEAAYRWSTSDM